MQDNKDNNNNNANNDSNSKKGFFVGDKQYLDSDNAKRQQADGSTARPSTPLASNNFADNGVLSNTTVTVATSNADNESKDSKAVVHTDNAVPPNGNVSFAIAERGQKAVGKAKNWLSNTVTRLKKVKHIEFYLAGVAIGLMLLIYFSSSIFGGGGTTKPNDDASGLMTYDRYCMQQEQKLEKIVGNIKGTGEVSVAIHFESSIEYIIAVIKSESANGSTETPMLVTENGVTKPIIVKEIYPQALGVVVVSDGANDPKVVLSIENTVAIMFNIPKNKIVITQHK